MLMYGVHCIWDTQIYKPLKRHSSLDTTGKSMHSKVQGTHIVWRLNIEILYTEVFFGYFLDDDSNHMIYIYTQCKKKK
jgi:hypothetical protein